MDGHERDLAAEIEAMMESGLYNFTGTSSTPSSYAKTPFDYMRALMDKPRPRLATTIKVSNYELVKAVFADPHFPMPNEPQALYGVRIRVDPSVFDYAMETYDQKGKLMEVTDLRFGISVKVGGDTL